MKMIIPKIGNTIAGFPIELALVGSNPIAFKYPAIINTGPRIKNM